MAKKTANMSDAVDLYLAKAAGFAQPVLEFLREVIHEGAPGVVEEMKWSRPFFVYKGVILGNISAFKAHCSLGLWGPGIEGAVREGGDAKGEGMGTFGKITSVKELPARTKLVGYVAMAAKAIDDGVRTKAWERPRQAVAKGEVEVPEALAAAFKKNKAAAEVFAGKGPGWQREYCDWILGAKQEATREKRVTQAVEWMAEGKGRNWKYE